MTESQELAVSRITARIQSMIASGHSEAEINEALNIRGWNHAEAKRLGWERATRCKPLMT